MELLPADYVLCGLALVMTITGLFRGFSGTLAFALASASAALVAYFGWEYSQSFTTIIWARSAGVLVVSLLTFGLVRLIVKKLVNGLLAQPSDALFGAVIGAVIAAAVVVGWAYSGLYLEYSNLASEVALYVR